MKTPVLRAPRLVLEPLGMAHAEELFRLFQDPALHRWTSRGAPDSLEEFREGVAELESGLSPDGTSEWLNWVVLRRGDPEIVGKVEADIEVAARKANLAYYTFGESTGRGYATEACRAVVEHIWQHRGVDVITISMDVENVASVRVAQNLGAHRVSRGQVDGVPGSESREEYVYELPRP